MNLDYISGKDVNRKNAEAKHQGEINTSTHCFTDPVIATITMSYFIASTGLQIQFKTKITHAKSTSP